MGSAEDDVAEAFHWIFAIVFGIVVFMVCTSFGPLGIILGAILGWYVFRKVIEG